MPSGGYVGGSAEGAGSPKLVGRRERGDHEQVL